MMKKLSDNEIIEIYGIDPCWKGDVTYYINDADMLVVVSKAEMEFEGPRAPIETVYGSFSDVYFYYFKKIHEDKQ